MTALEADTAFGWHFGPRFALQPFRHLGAVGIEFAVFPLGEVEFVHDFAVEQDGDFRALGGEGHAVPFAGGFDGALGRGLMAEEGAAAQVGGLFLPWLRAVVADLDFDAGGHPVHFVAVVEEDAAFGSGLELEFDKHLIRAKVDPPLPRQTDQENADMRDSGTPIRLVSDGVFMVCRELFSQTKSRTNPLRPPFFNAHPAKRRSDKRRECLRMTTEVKT